MGEISRFTLALDSELKEAMLQKAKENDRNLNGEISRAVKFYLKHAQSVEKFVPEATDIANNIEINLEPETTDLIKKEEERTPLSSETAGETSTGENNTTSILSKPKSRRI